LEKKVGREMVILQPADDEREEMLRSLTQLLGYVSLDAEELNVTELAAAVDRAIVIATQHITQSRVA